MFLGGLFFEWIQTVFLFNDYGLGSMACTNLLDYGDEKKYLGE